MLYLVEDLEVCERRSGGKFTILFVFCASVDESISRYNRVDEIFAGQNQVHESKKSLAISSSSTLPLPKNVLGVNCFNFLVNDVRSYLHYLLDTNGFGMNFTIRTSAVCWSCCTVSNILRWCYFVVLNKLKNK